MTSKNSRLILKDFLPYRLSVLSNRISSAIAARYSEKFGLSLPQWRIMAILGETDDISANEVAERTAMDKVAVSRAVKQLLSDKRIERHFSKEDKRRSVLRLSDDGIKTYNEVVPIAAAYEQEMLKDMTETDKAHLRRLLDDLDRTI